MNQSANGRVFHSGHALDVEAGASRTTFPTKRLIDRSNPHKYTSAADTDISVHLKRYKALQQKQLKVAGSKK